MSKPNTDKVFREIDKCETPEEIIDLYNEIKNYCTIKLTEAQKAHETKANTIQENLDKINGVNQ